jgi:hypothetical protein
MYLFPSNVMSKELLEPVWLTGPMGFDAFSLLKKDSLLVLWKHK